jgi:hypothetical protein
VCTEVLTVRKENSKEFGDKIKSRNLQLAINEPVALEYCVI